MIKSVIFNSVFFPPIGHSVLYTLSSNFAILKTLNCFQFIESNLGPKVRIRGGTDLKRGYGDVRPWRPPFHASPAARKGPISSKRVSSQDPLLRNFGNFSLYSLNFTQILAHEPPNLEIFSSQAPNLEIFSSQAPKFGNFLLTSPPFRDKCQFASPTLRKSGPHTPTWKKVECPLPGVRMHKIVRPDL